MYASRLVDLPNIIESQKTFDSRHLFKVADISQASDDRYLIIFGLLTTIDASRGRAGG
jgi:hypothetical protein